MNKYIFLTTEGYTCQPNSENIEPDYNNAQLIEIIEYENQKEAFKNLLEKYDYLKTSNFEEVYCYQLIDNCESTRKSFIIEKDN